MPSQPPIGYQLVFGCSGHVTPGKDSVHLSCGTSHDLKGGEYRVAADGLRLLRMLTGESQTYPTARFPIITVKPAKPYDPTVFPEIGQPQLALTVGQTMSDGADRTQEILNELSSNYLGHTKETPETKRFLLDLIRREKAIVHLTGLRYGAATIGQPLPIFFDDFDQRLNQVEREIDGSSGTGTSAALVRKAPEARYLLVQMPKTTDSVDAQPPPGSLSKTLATLTEILTDFISLGEKINDPGMKEFKWSILTTPKGADVYYSRLNKPEEKWAGGTDVVGASLRFARWTWRIDWHGCFKIEKPNPYQQEKIEMKLSEEGCKKK